jgi:voltage-gated potassium channel Kch
MRENRGVEGISDHIIICGHQRIGPVLARELALNGSPFVIDDLELTDFAFFAGAGDVFHIWNPRKLLADSDVPEGTRKRCAHAMKEKGATL